MCSPTRCRRCGRTTWAGCGLHVEEVRAMVPAEQWCADGRSCTPTEAVDTGGWLQRILRR